MEQNETIRSILVFNPKFGVYYQIDNQALPASFAIANREPNRSDFVESSPNSDHFTKPCTIPKWAIKWKALILPSRQLLIT